MRRREYSRETIQSIQRAVGSHPDGVLGPDTCRRLSVFTARYGDDWARAWDSIEDAPELDVRKVGLDSHEYLIDVSHHQGVIDWERVEAVRLHGAYIKATEGQTCVDPRFKDNWRLARGLVRRGAYHLARPVFGGDARPARREAEAFVAALGVDVGELRPALDLETKYLKEAVAAAGAPWVAAWIKDWVQHVSEQAGVDVILYLSHRGARTLGHAMQAIPDTVALWWADDREGRDAPDTWSVGRWDLWQIGSKYRCPGIKGDVDLDRLAPGADLVISEYQDL